MSNNLDPDKTAHYEPSHLDLCCLQKPIIIVCDSEIVKELNNLNKYVNTAETYHTAVQMFAD